MNTTFPRPSQGLEESGRVAVHTPAMSSATIALGATVAREVELVVR